MNRAAGELHAVLERLPLRVETGKRRQETGMDVQNSPAKRVNKTRRQQSHVSGQTCKGNLMDEFGRGAVKGIFNGVVGKVKKEFDDAKKMADAGAFSDAGGGGSQRWAGVASRALQILHLPGSWLGPLLRLIQRESGGNPMAINRTDSNAARGTPSKGLMQTIGPTFAAYAMRGFDRDIYDPLSNILAGLRYIVARYHSIFNV